MAIAELIRTKRWAFEMVRVAGLKTDPVYHAGWRYDQKRVDRYAREFSEDKVGTLTISERSDGSRWIIDGQHRAGAAKVAGVDYLPARVFYDLTIEQEAEIFFALSDFVRLSQDMQWKARLVSHDAVALATTEVLDAHGVRIVMGGSTRPDPRTTRAIGAIEALYRVGLLSRVVTVVRTVWPEDIHGLDAQVLWGIGSFLAVYDDRFPHPALVRGRLEAKLGEYPASALLRAIKEVTGSGRGRFATGLSGSGSGSILNRRAERTAVLDSYNRRSSTRRLPEASLSDLRAFRDGRSPW